MLSWFGMASFSIEQASLLLANIDPLEVEGLDYAQNNNWVGANQALGWAEAIKSALIESQIQADKNLISIIESVDQYLEAGEICYEPVTTKISQRDVNYDHRIDITETRIRRGELKSWLAKNYSKAAYFLLNRDEMNTALLERGLPEGQWIYDSGICSNHKKVTELFIKNAISSEPENKEHSPAVSETSADLQHLQSLLDGTSNYQAPELAICLRAWLALSTKAESSPEKKLKNGVTTEIEFWLSENHPSIKSSAALDRIKKVTNWNK